MTPSLLALPVRPRPMEGELSMGYLSRVAVANGYEDIRFLFRAISRSGMSISEALQLDAEEIARLFGSLPCSRGIDLSTTYDIATTHFNHHYLRWCPACLQATGYFCGAWGLKLCCVCVQHGARLVEACPSCHERQPISHCLRCCTVCGCDLSRAFMVPAGSALIELHARLQLALETCRRTRNNEEVLKWLRLVKYLGPFVADPWCRRPGQTGGLHRLPEAMALLEATACLLDNWPVNFDALLHRVRSCEPRATHLAHAFGRLYRVLYRDLDGDVFDPLREAFERYLNEHWFGLLGRRNRRLQTRTVSCHPQRATKAVARDAGVGAAAVRHLAGSGSIIAHTKQHASGRVTRVVSSSEAARVEELKRDSVTLRQAAVLLRIGRRRVRELIDAGLVHAWIDRRQTQAATWWLCKADMVRLASIGEPTGSTGRRQGWVDLATVLKTWRLASDEFASIARALLTNDLVARRPVCQPAGMGTIEMRISQIRKWHYAFREKHQISLSVDGAAKRLGIKQQVAYELVARGIIECTVEGRCRRISPSAISDFRNTYISLAELAAAHSMRPCRMVALLACRPVCGPGVDGARQYFYRRADLAQTLNVFKDSE